MQNDKLPSKAAARTPNTLCLKLPGTSLGDDNKHPMAMLIPISRLPDLEKIIIGKTIAIVSTMAFEKSVLLRNFIKSF